MSHVCKIISTFRPLKLIAVAFICNFQLSTISFLIPPRLFHFILAITNSVVIAFCNVGQNSVSSSMTDILFNEILFKELYIAIDVCVV